jgi:hypothetical protein
LYLYILSCDGEKGESRIAKKGKKGVLMRNGDTRTIDTPENEFLPKKQELFNLYLKMPVQFKEDWLLFRKRCREQGLLFEDVLGNLIMQFHKGDIFFKGDNAANGKERK